MGCVDQLKEKRPSDKKTEAMLSGYGNVKDGCIFVNTSLYCGIGSKSLL